MTSRAGMTLIELLIVLALLGLLSGVAALAPRGAEPLTRIDQSLGDSVRLTASDAIARAVVHDSSAAWVLPDGRIIADSAFHVDPITGRSHRAR